MFPVLLLVAAGVACGARKSTTDEEVAPAVRFENVQFQVFSGAALSASGTAASVNLRRDTNALSAERIAVDFPASAGREAARVTAERGSGDVAERWFVVEQGVRAVQADDVATTERARFDRADGMVRGDRPVALQGPGYQLRGPGFVLDPSDRTVRVEGGASIRAGEAGR